MDANKVDASSKDTVPSLDPLRRVFVPRETRMLDAVGDPIGWRFKTLDKTRYTRSQDGVIRRVDPKPISKKERRACNRG